MKNERFTSRDIEKIRLIASSRFTELLPIYQRERIVQIPDGIRCPCPIHGGDGKNFTWNTQYYNWTCWSNHCGKADDVFSFIEKLHHLSFSEALYYLADFTNIRPNSNTTLPQKIIIPTIVDKKLIPLPENFLRYCIGTHGYWERVLPQTKDIIEGGYCLLKNSPLYKRITFPVRDHNGILVGVTGRITSDVIPEDFDDFHISCWKNCKYYHCGMNKVDSNGNPIGGFTKSLVLYNYHNAKKYPYRPLLIVEGQFDVARAIEMGYPSTVAILGSDISDYQLKLACDKHNHIIYALDPDTFEKKTIKEFIKRVKKYGNSLSIMALPDGMDVGSISTELFIHEIRRAIYCK